MYNTDIQTTLSVLGHIVFIEYRATEEWAIEWWLNPGEYADPAEPDEAGPGIELLEALLRTYERNRIEEQLLNDFESRKYAHDESLAAQFANEDIPF